MRKFRILSEDTLFEERTQHGTPADRLQTIEKAYNPLSALKHAVETSQVHAQRRVVLIEELISLPHLTDSDLKSLLTKTNSEFFSSKLINEKFTVNAILKNKKKSMQTIIQAIVDALAFERIANLSVVFVHDEDNLKAEIKEFQLQVFYPDQGLGKFIIIELTNVLPHDDFETPWDITLALAREILEKSQTLI